MGTKMVSLRLDEELLGWATAYAKERGVSRTGVVEAALRSYRGDRVDGVPDFGLGDLPVVGVPGPGLLSAVTANASHPGGELTEEVLVEALEQASKPRPAPPVVAPRVRPARSKQSELAMARMRRMDPGRYGHE
jgi:hypothetical protein